MATSTTTRSPANRGPERPDGNYARQALKNRPTAGDPTRADRNADVGLGAAVIAMGLLAGLYFFSAIAVMPALTAAEDRTLVDAMQRPQGRVSGCGEAMLRILRALMPGGESGGRRHACVA